MFLQGRFGGMLDKKQHLLFGFLIILGLSILGYNYYVAHQQRFNSYGDASDYLMLGTTLAKTGKYGHLDTSTNNLIADFKANVVGSNTYEFKNQTTWRAPVWPTFIALVFTLLGYSLTTLLIIKFLLHGFGIYLFYIILKRLSFHESICAIGCFLYAVAPVWQLYSRVFLSEPFTLFLITLFIYTAINVYCRKGRWFWHIIVSTILILSHPYYVFLPFSLWLILWFSKFLHLKKFLLFTICTLGLVSLWPLRNAIVLNTNSYVITTSSGAVMAKGWNKDVVEKHTNTQGDLANESLVLQEYPEQLANQGEVAKSKHYSAAVVYFIQNNPSKILPIIFTKLRSAFNPFRESSKPGILQDGRVLFHVLSLIALIVLLFQQKSFVRSLALGLCLATIGITIITYSGFRFRSPQFPIELLMIIFVSVQLWQNFSARREL